jgi:putative membrane protein insertion efficiency factor
MQKIVIAIVKFYKIFISPLKGVACCRFQPTCSDYMIEAVKKFGVIKGGFLGIKRIIRCNPFGGSGFDPVQINIR